MKLRHPFLIKTCGFAAAWAVRLWIGSVRYRYRPLGPNVDPNQTNIRDRYIYAFWHENLLLPAYQYGRPDIWLLISQHADGQFIAEICRHLRFKAVRGSTTRGSIEAVRTMLKKGQHSHLAVTPDGPRGPRRQVQPGLIYLAAKTGLPIAPIGFCYDKAWRLRSWDRFVLPKPWSLSTCVTTDLINVPQDVDKAGMELYRCQVQSALDLATETAAEKMRKSA